MKHYFIMNPHAGKTSSCELITNEVKRVFNEEDNYVLYETKGAGDAFYYVKEVCDKLTEDAVFYACGGDGTVYEVMNGLVNCKHAILGIMPTGSCNDFLKSFPEHDFSSVENLVNGEVKPLDVLKINDFYSINVANCGFDAKVNDDVQKMVMKHKNVKKAYNMSIIKNIIKKKADKVKIFLDDVLLKIEKTLLMAFGNGGFYGGGYHCAPFAKIDDGLIEAVIVKDVSILKFASLVGKYKAGTHLDNDKYKDIITYKQVKKVVIDAEEPLCFCVDGETVWDKHFDIEILKHQTRIMIPRKN